MFGKRRRAASNPAQRAPPSASASLAATKAFVRDRESSEILSSAAAAAALRTHVTTPTLVGDTVTKRMVRRNSASSNGSNPRPGLLRRQSSTASMTERSFRAASPGRGSPADPNAPPVPAVPKNMQQGGAVHRRASSLEPAYRGGSPTPRGGGRGVSLDRGEQNTAAARGQRPTGHLAQVSEEEDAAGRSVNFSRPMSPGTPTSNQNPSPPSGRGWFGGPVVNQEAVQRMASTSRPKTSGGISEYDRHSTQHSVQNAANQPVKTHQYSQGVEGFRLSSGSMRAKPSGSAVQSRSYLPPATQQAPRTVDPNSPNAIYDPSTRTFIHKQDAMARHRELQQEPEPQSQHYVAQRRDGYQPQQIPQQPSRRSPSPVRRYVQYVREEPPAPQKREEVVLPQLDTTTHRREPEARPAEYFAPEPRSGPTIERRSSEDFADADFQPPELANTGRRLDDVDQGVEHETPTKVASHVSAASQDNSYPRLATPVIATTTNSVAGQSRGSVRTGHDRQSSLSPPRNAHFAPIAIELAGEKHQPPPRSISPAKSALKPSPSVSRRGSSPITGDGHLQIRGAASEASDTTSEDGSKKKRNFRVSFEEKPFVAGATANADADSPTSPAGLGASKWSQAAAEQEDDFTDFMKPRSALPSFSSIRDRDRRSTEDNEAEKVTETVSTTPMSASVGSIGEPLHSSSDHVVGSILAQDFAQKGVTNDPLPPEVTSVEGSGYVSDSSDDSSLQKHGEEKQSTQQPLIPEPKSLTTQLDEKSSTPGAAFERIVEVPQIALLPATPSPHERPEPKFQSMMIPGGWADETPDDIERSIAPTETVSKAAPFAPAVDPVHQQPEPVSHAEEDDTTDDNSSIYSDAYEDLTDTEGGFGSIDAMVERPVIPPSSGLMHSQYANRSATETTTESSTSKLQRDRFADDDSDSDTTPTQEWDATRRPWSGATTAQKQPQHKESPVEQRSHAEEVVARVMQAPVVQEEPRTERQVVAKTSPQILTSPPASQTPTKPLKSALKKNAVAQPTQAAEPQTRQTMRGAPRQGPPPRQGPSSDTQMKKTMRTGPNTSTSRAEPQMRSSMRASNEPTSRVVPQMRKSMRSDDFAPSTSMGLAASRHSMVPMDTKPPRGALQKRHIPAAAPVPKPRPQSLPATKQAAAAPTYDSDSDASASSFQRTRARGRGNQSGRYTMRGSMRQEPAPTMRASAPALKQVRSISPPGSPTPALRKSMRPTSAIPATPEPIRNSKFSIRSLSPMGRFRSSKSPDAGPPSPTQPKKMPAFNKQPKQKAERGRAVKAPIKSRFADSSDEDGDDKPRRFQSRFADSDSDDADDYKLPPGLAPVRGIPRKAGEEDGDSTDLEEEADNESLMPPSTPVTKSGPATNGVTNGQTSGKANSEGAILATGSLRDSKHAPALPSFEGGSKAKAKRGFFGLGKKKVEKATEKATVTEADAAAPPVPAPSDIPMPPTKPNRELGLPLTPIDEDKDFDAVENSPQSRRSPKLQRRSTPEWPLAPPPAIGKEERPMSSDGIAPRRPRFQGRQASTMSNTTDPIIDAQGRSVSYGRSGKKKKFQGLRRVFGLND
ncbi:uncharacterized protein K460DRAFT_348411 [Cucurbitaria berberidis CBS 394.84]|uniref:Uncharacterized protein n=1 Tax=Cucurbitaria berberidis CBS 394.84 TaxID=1168544 RepID=A0A9P4L2Y6_9PLEO|nr:uncharacterized protein K460DRAFT_348411 [Cucurbitaria berberidis CBS 394.84]KAF1840216.1 hypothetical protein K460DRAFT_348411 [Cucurbitaria berberidis CBS 394.84]